MSRKSKIKALAAFDVVRGQNSLRVRAEADHHVIDLCGTIGKSWMDDDGISEKEFRDALKQVPEGKPVRININSEGGSVQDGLGMYNAICEHPSDTSCKINGYALSIASVIPLAADKVISPKSSIWMIHKAWSFAQGNSDDMRQAADMLEAHDETLVDLYTEHTGQTKAAIREAMEKETWMKGADAVDFGLADETEEEEEKERAPNGSFSYRPLAKGFLDRCKNVSPAILNCLNPNALTDEQRQSLRAALKDTRPAFESISAEPIGGQQQQKKDNTMDKKKIVALLDRHGIKASELETDEQLEAKLNQISLAKPANQTAGSPTPQLVIDLLAITSRLDEEKRHRLTDRVNKYVDTQQITKDEVDVWVGQAMTDEKKTFDLLDKRPMAETGGDPIGYTRIEGGNYPTLAGYQGRPTDAIANFWKEHKTPQAKWEGLKQSFGDLRRDAAARDAKYNVRAENTFAGGITTNFLIMGAITKLGPMIAPLKAFTKDNSVDPYKPLAAGIQKFNVTVQDGTDTQTNATDFSISADSTLNAVTISPAQYTQGLHLSNSQLNSGIRMADLIEAKLGSFRSKIAQVCTAPITVANFPGPIGVGGPATWAVPAAAFTFSDLAALQGALKKSPVKNVLLDGEYIARIANTPGFFQQAGTLQDMDGAWKAFGWDLIALNTEWQAAGANVRGFACHPQAIGVIAGLPLNPPEGIPGNVVQTGVAELSQADIAIATYLWYDVNPRVLRATYDLMLGATLVDSTAGFLITSQ